MKRFLLLYGELEVGTVLQEDADFPNCLGTWTSSTGVDQPSLRERIAAYVSYSEHADSLMADGDITDAWDAYVREREPEFFDLINSDEWGLRAEDGETIPVLVPRFCVGGEVVWRYDTR